MVSVIIPVTSLPSFEFFYHHLNRYLDCGYGSWMGGSNNNWCSPYISWERAYMNSPRRIIQNFGLSYNSSQILGGETAMWSEQVGDSGCDDDDGVNQVNFDNRWTARRLKGKCGHVVLLWLSASGLILTRIGRRRSPEWSTTVNG